MIGLKDFLRPAARVPAARFIFHAKATIRKDLVTAMQRTKALGLLHRAAAENAAMCRMGPDYLITVRAPGESERVTHGAEFPVDLWRKLPARFDGHQPERQPAVHERP